MKKLYPYLLPALLVSFYLSEGFGKLYYLFTWDRSLIQIATKLLILPIIIPHLIKSKKQLILIPSVVLCFIIGQLLIDNGLGTNILINSAKYIYFLIFLSFFSYNKDACINGNWQLSLEAIAIINSILILIGFIFKLTFFESYTGDRFGYNGLLISSATSSYFHFFVLGYFFIKLKDNFLKNYKVLFVIATSLLIGTKSTYLLNFIFIFAYLFFFVSSYKIKFYGLLLLAIIFICFSYYVLFVWPIFQSIVTERGISYAILSDRNQIFMSETLPFLKEKWNIINFLFGGIDNIAMRPQLGLFDLFLFFGVIGLSLFLYSLYISFFKKLKLKVLSVFLICIISLLIFTTGNFFINTSVCVYSVALFYAFLKYGDNEITNKKMI